MVLNVERGSIKVIFELTDGARGQKHIEKEKIDSAIKKTNKKLIN